MISFRELRPRKIPAWLGPLPPRFKLPTKLPHYIQRALRKHPAALRFFEALTPLQRRRYVGWIESAKREETKDKRLKEASSPSCGWQGAGTQMRCA